MRQLLIIIRLVTISKLTIRKCNTLNVLKVSQLIFGFRNTFYYDLNFFLKKHATYKSKQISEV